MKNLVEPPMDIRLRGVIGPMRGDVEKEVRRIPAEGDGKDITEGRKTRAERGIVRRCISALNRFRQQVGLAPVRISERRIHIVEPDEFLRAFPEHADSFGVSDTGHAYVIRSPKLVTLTIGVAHELIHLSGYKRFRVVVSFAPAADDEGITNVELTIRERRSGLSRSHGADFLGLNEAVTEIAAGFVRETVLERPHNFTSSETDELKEDRAYVPQIEVVTSLLEEVWEDPVAGFTLAFWDAMTGTDDFLRHIKQVKPEAIEPLRKMTGSVESACLTALALGYDKVVDEICKEYFPDGLPDFSNAADDSPMATTDGDPTVEPTES